MTHPRASSPLDSIGAAGRHFAEPMRLALLALALACGLCTFSGDASAPVRGLTQPAALARTYDAILDADFAAVDTHMAPVCGPAPVWCEVLQAAAVWWRIELDPDDRTYDAQFRQAVEQAIVNAEGWTRDEPQRAEAWFARGAAYGARAQWRVLRKERVAAARDGTRIKEALERALQLDPELHDAKFGIGMYRYYADVAPAALRLLRWLLLLPGGDRTHGLRQMLDARDRGHVIHGEADYQLHLIYLWYEHRAPEALALIRGLQRRHPRNPLFSLIDARIADVYFHDARGSEQTLRALIARAHGDRLNLSTLAERRAQHALRALQSRVER
jgi:hypothetical protein